MDENEYFQTETNRRLERVEGKIDILIEFMGHQKGKAVAFSLFAGFVGALVMGVFEFFSRK